jgi:hypothetical protein
MAAKVRIAIADQTEKVISGSVSKPKKVISGSALSLEETGTNMLASQIVDSLIQNMKL